MSNTIKLRTYYFTSDWTDFRTVDIDLDEWTYFTVNFRCDSWHLIGHKYVKKTDSYEAEWEREELSNHGCYLQDLAEFIAEANAYPEKNGLPRNRVSNFNNLHYSKKFYGRLSQLLSAVEKNENARKGGVSA